MPCLAKVSCSALSLAATPASRILHCLELIGRVGWHAFQCVADFGDGPRVQTAAVWDCEDAGLAATSIPSVILTP